MTDLLKESFAAYDNKYQINKFSDAMPLIVDIVGNNNFGMILNLISTADNMLKIYVVSSDTKA